MVVLIIPSVQWLLIYRLEIINKMYRQLGALKIMLSKQQNGLFGEKNRKNGRIPREIFSKNPSTAATLFFNTLSQGGQKHVFNTSNGKGIEATLKDGSKITYRPLTSSIGSPAVEITISMSPDVKPKKYHFVQKGGNKK
jgi:hypothetical protein